MVNLLFLGEYDGWRIRKEGFGNGCVCGYDWLDGLEYWVSVGLIRVGRGDGEYFDFFFYW